LVRRWPEILQSPLYQELDEEEKKIFQQEYWDTVIEKSPLFKELSRKEREQFRSEFFAPTPEPSIPPPPPLERPAPPEREEVPAPTPTVDEIPAPPPPTGRGIAETLVGTDPLGEVGYALRRVFGATVTEPVAATSELFYKGLGAFFDLVGAERATEWARESEKAFQPGGQAEVQKFSDEVRAEAQQRAQALEEMYGPAGKLFAHFTESATDIISLLARMKGVGVAARPGIAPGYGQIAQPGLVFAHRAVTTPGELEERLRSATYTTALTMTPLLAVATGAKGVKASMVDAMINAGLGHDVYRQSILAMSENPLEAATMLFEQIALDIAFAIPTRQMAPDHRNRLLRIYAQQDPFRDPETTETMIRELWKKAGEIPSDQVADAIKKADPEHLPHLREYLRMTPEGLKVDEAFRPEELRPDVWQKTLEEAAGKVPKPGALAEDRYVYQADRQYWLDEVRDAIERGEPVSDKVMEEYRRELVPKAPTPEESLPYDREMIKDVDREAAEYRRSIRDAIRELGGVKDPDYEDIPLHLKRKTGHGLDELAGELRGMGFPVRDAEDVYSLIKASAEPKPPSPEQALDRQEPIARELDQREAPTRPPTEFGEDVLRFAPNYPFINDTVRKLTSRWDVEAPLVKAGAPETGFRIKNYHSQIEALQREGLHVISEMTRAGKEMGMSADDFIRATFAAESGEYMKGLSPADRTRVEGVVKQYEAFRKKWATRLKEIGWMPHEFPQSLVLRNEETIKVLEREVQKSGTPGHKLLTQKQMDKKKSEIDRLREQNKRIKDLDLRFVSVPFLDLIADAEPGSKGAAISEHFMRIMPHWGRETVSLKDLYDTGKLDPKTFDLRGIVGEYVERMSRTYALGLIFREAEKEGLIASAADRPEWPEFRAKLIPQLKDKRFNPAFNDMLTAYFGATGRHTGVRGTFEHVMALTKMMQFYNPLFLPMYDVMQSAATGALASIATPRNIRNAWIMASKQNPDYIEAMEHGLFSKPFTMSWEEYEGRMKKAMNEKHVRDNVEKMRDVILTPYQLSWNTAWKLDEFVRLVTYNHLKGKGMEPREAAQVAAKFHSDYACYSKDTEVLTQEGWKLIKDVQAEEKVVTLNPVNREIEYKPVKETYVYDHNGNMYHCRHARLDFIVTANHRLPVCGYKSRETIQFIPVEEFLQKNNSHWSLQITGKWGGESPHKFRYKNVEMPFHAYCAFMGLYLSEGDLDNRGYDIRIAQYEAREDFQRALDNTGLRWVRNKKCWRSSHKVFNEYLRQFGKAKEKYVPSIIKNAKRRDIRAFLEFYSKGDGFIRENSTTYIYTTSKQMANDLQELILKAGWNSRLTPKPTQTSIITENGKKRAITNGGGYSVSIKKRFQHTTLRPEQFSPIPYNDKIYSLFVENNIIYVRRNGIPHFNGNSVPPNVRHFLNKFLFTPTFRMSMTKLYADMGKGMYNTLFHPRTATVTDKTYAKGMVAAFAMMQGVSHFMAQLGFEEEQKFRSYVKNVETEEGVKELRMTVANPFNIPWRYYYRGKMATEPWQLNKWQSLFEAFKWDLHPLLRTGLAIYENRYEEIYNPLDSADNQLRDVARYAMREIVAITKPFTEPTGVWEAEREAETLAAMQQNLGTLYTMLLRPFVFSYLRDVKEVRVMRRIDRVQREMETIIRHRMLKEPGKVPGMIENMHKVIMELMKELE